MHFAYANAYGYILLGVLGGGGDDDNINFYIMKSQS